MIIFSMLIISSESALSFEERQPFEKLREKDGKPVSLEMIYRLPQSSLTPLVQRSFFFKIKKACQNKREFFANEFK